MSLLTVSDIALRINGRVLLDNASIGIDAGHKVGLIGRNGAGKSTLLGIIAGDITPDSGSITIAARARMGRVRQEAASGPITVLETVLEADTERDALMKELEKDPSEIPIERLADIHDRLNDIDAHSAPARAAAILAGLGFDEKAQASPMSDFSGGWRMRVSLAGALFTEPDLLLLDEPTNHLDLEASLWLESWLKRYSGTVLLVSHDRTLLDNVADSILHLDKGKLSLTPGGISRFERIKTERALQQNRQAAKVAEQREKMESFVERFRAKATKAKQAQARLKALARLPDIDAVTEDIPVQFEFPTPEPLAPPMIDLDKVSLGYPDKTVLENISLRIDMGDRIALLGRNGQGKSTLAKCLAQALKPLAGEMKTSNKLRIGYFAQHQQEALVLEDTPLDHMLRALPDANITQARAQLARFGLDSERVETKVEQLSGGEKARLLLSLATRSSPHLLILDEPTNHLDMDARNSLIRALMEFEGAVLLISHDSYLVESVADRLLLVAGGKLTPFDGDMDEYRQWLEQDSRSARSQKKADTKEINEKKGTGGDNKYALKAQRKELMRALGPLKKEIQAAEKKVTELEERKARIEAELAKPDLYESGNPGKITALNTKLAEVNVTIKLEEDIWMTLQAKLEEKMNEIE